MEQTITSRTLSYIVIIALLFGALYVLDVVLKDHYASEEFNLTLRDQQPNEESTKVQKASFNLADTERNQTLRTKNDEETPATYHRVEDAEVKNGELYFEQLKEKYQREILSKLPKHKSRTDVTIRYYRHPPDGTSAYALQKLGYYIHERPVDPGYERFQSNAIFYGDNVKMEDIQLVAYTLLKEGLPLKTIAPSRFGSNWKSHSIEIGADSTLISMKTLTLSDIRKLAR